MTIETSDAASIQTLVGQEPRVIASSGGWNFPSACFAKLVVTSDSRAKIISNAKSFIANHGMNEGHRHRLGVPMLACAHGSSQDHLRPILDDGRCWWLVPSGQGCWIFPLSSHISGSGLS